MKQVQVKISDKDIWFLEATASSKGLSLERFIQETIDNIIAQVKIQLPKELKKVSSRKISARYAS